MAVFDISMVNRFFKEYDEKRLEEPQLLNELNLDGYDDFKKLKMKTSHYIKSKRMLVVVNFSCSIDERTGNISERLREGTKKITVVFEEDNQKHIAVVELPSKVDCDIAISDAKKQEILEQVSLVNKTNGIFSESMVHYENLIQNLRVALEQDKENMEMKKDEEESIELQGKEVVKAKLATEVHFGKKIKVKQNNQIIEKVITEGDILIVRVDGEKNVILDENGEPIRDVLSEDEFTERFGTFYSKEDYYVSEDSTVILNLKPDVELDEERELSMSAEGFNTEATDEEDGKVKIPYDPYYSIKENLDHFAKEMEHVRADFINMPNYTFCTSDGKFIDPDMAKAMGQSKEFAEEKTKELIYKPNRTSYD